MFLISNPTYPLLVFRETIDFCVLTLHPVTLLKLLIIRIFCCCWFFLKFFPVDNHIIHEQKQFYVFLTSPYAFYFLFLCYKKCCIMLKRKDERGHPCLIPDFSGKALLFSTVSMMLAVDFLVDILYQVEEILLRYSLLRVLIVHAYCVCACSVASVVSDHVRPYGLYLPGSSVRRVLQARMLEWVPCCPPGALPDAEVAPGSLLSPAPAGRSSPPLPPSCQTLLLRLLVGSCDFPPLACWCGRWTSFVHLG